MRKVPARRTPPAERRPAPGRASSLVRVIAVSPRARTSPGTAPTLRSPGSTPCSGFRPRHHRPSRPPGPAGRPVRLSCRPAHRAGHPRRVGAPAGPDRICAGGTERRARGVAPPVAAGPSRREPGRHRPPGARRGAGATNGGPGHGNVSEAPGSTGAPPRAGQGPGTAARPPLPADPLRGGSYRRPSRTRLLAGVAAVAILGVTGVTGTLVVMHSHQTAAPAPAAASATASAPSSPGESGFGPPGPRGGPLELAGAGRSADPAGQRRPDHRPGLPETGRVLRHGQRGQRPVSAVRRDLAGGQPRTRTATSSPSPAPRPGSASRSTPRGTPSRSPRGHGAPRPWSARDPGR